MEAVKSSYLEQLLQGLPALPADQRNELVSLRAEALERANALAVPTTRDEEWRFTDLSPLYRTSSERVEQPACRAGTSRCTPGRSPRRAAGWSFVDGQFDAALSELRLETGITVTPLAAAVAQSNPVLPAHLGKYADFRAEPFAAVNTAWLQDGALIACAAQSGRGRRCICCS